MPSSPSDDRLVSSPPVAGVLLVPLEYPEPVGDPGHVHEHSDDPSRTEQHALVNVDRKIVIFILKTVVMPVFF